jgi:hypothetical protein
MLDVWAGDLTADRSRGSAAVVAIVVAISPLTAFLGYVYLTQR